MTDQTRKDVETVLNATWKPHHFRYPKDDQCISLEFIEAAQRLARIVTGRAVSDAARA